MSPERLAESIEHVRAALRRLNPEFYKSDISWPSFSAILKEVDRLTEERDERTAYWREVVRQLGAERRQLRAERDRLSARVTRLEDALRQIVDPSYVGNYDHEQVVEIYRKWASQALADSKALAGSSERITHGRHCTCGACAREDWTQSHLACCGMHGKDCPPEYQPLGYAGSYVAPRIR
jgi:hypothetical protein